MPRRWLPIFLSIFLTAAVISALLVWRQQQSVPLKNGGSVDDLSLTYTIYDEGDRALNRTTGHISLKAPASIVESHILTFFRYQNLEIYEPGSKKPIISLVDTPYQRMHNVELTEAMYCAETGTLEFYWSSDATQFIGSIYLAPNDVTEWRVTNARSIGYMVLGIALLMWAHSLFMLICKSDEDYLIYYVVYASTLFFIVGLNVMPFGLTMSPGLRAVMQHMVSMLNTAAGVLVCLKFIDFPLQKKLSTAAYIAVLLALVAVYLMCMELIGTGAAELLRLACILALSPALFGACRKGIRGTALLLVGHSVRLGFVLMQILVNLGFTEDWLSFSLLRTSAFLELPLAFAVLFCITMRFADKFKDSEELGRKLTQFNQQLDEMVAVRTGQYKREQELRHNMMLNIFHDIRTPLFTLQGGLDILSAAVPQEAELTEVMKHRLAFVKNLSDDLFLLAKLEDSDWLIPFSSVTLPEVICPVCESLQKQAEDKGVSLELEALPELPLWANRDQLQRAFQNLIVNALHYTPSGGRVTVSCRSESGNLKVSIADTGKGMDEEALSHLFVRYFRSDPRHDPDSTGLGLSIAKTILERHNGGIEVESTVGKGSIMTVSLPLTEQ